MTDTKRQWLVRYHWYDSEGVRHHSIYVGSSPEYGKENFISRMENEISKVKKLYPDSHYIGIADGAKDNWSFLNKHTHRQTLDFYHVTEYLTKTSEATHPRKGRKQDRKQWLKEYCHKLKHEKNAAKDIIEEMVRLDKKYNMTQQMKDNLHAAQTYFENNVHRMNYWEAIDKKWPIGSGVTEAACKTLIKQRFCNSGMRWKQKGVKTVLSIRQIVQTKGRWKQFWSKIQKYGT